MNIQRRRNETRSSLFLVNFLITLCLRFSRRWRSFQDEKCIYRNKLFPPFTKGLFAVLFFMPIYCLTIQSVKKGWVFIFLIFSCHANYRWGCVFVVRDIILSRELQFHFASFNIRCLAILHLCVYIFTPLFWNSECSTEEKSREREFSTGSLFLLNLFGVEIAVWLIVALYNGIVDRFVIVWLFIVILLSVSSGKITVAIKLILW